MAKRGADKYLTDSNWDKEDDEPEERGTFVAASGDVLNQRTILKAKRRCNAADSTDSAALKSFSGFTSLSAGTDSKPVFSFASSTSADVQSYSFPVLAERDTKTGEKTAALNKQLLKWASDETSKNAGCDLTPGLTKYMEYVKNLVNTFTVVSLPGSSPAKPTSGDNGLDAAGSSSAASASTAVPLSELFQKPSDSWDCTVCFVNNKNSATSCVSCTSAKPLSKVVKEATPATTQPSLSELFKKAGDEWECATCWVRNKSTESQCVSCGEKAPKKTSDSPKKKSDSAESSAASSSTDTTTASTGFSLAPKGGFTFNMFGGAGTGGTPFSLGLSSSTTGSPFTFKPFTTSASSTATTQPAASTGTFSFGFGSVVSSTSSVLSKPSESGTADNKDEDENEEYVPPKPEAAAFAEPDAFYTVRCKLFFQIDGSWQDRGVGNLFLKPCGDRTQLLVRTDTSLGNILLNISLAPTMPVSRQGSNNVTFMCVPNPPLSDKTKKKDSDKMVATLIRVKTGQLADELLAKINESKGAQKDD